MHVCGHTSERDARVMMWCGATRKVRTNQFWLACPFRPNQGSGSNHLPNPKVRQMLQASARAPCSCDEGDVGGQRRCDMPGCAEANCMTVCTETTCDVPRTHTHLSHVPGDGSSPGTAMHRDYMNVVCSSPMWQYDDAASKHPHRRHGQYPR